MNEEILREVAKIGYGKNWCEEWNKAKYLEVRWFNSYYLRFDFDDNLIVITYRDNFMNIESYYKGFLFNHLAAIELLKEKFNVEII